MRRAAQVGLVAGRGTDFPVRGWGFTKPSAEIGVGRFYGQEDFPERQPFVCGSAGRALSSEARWVGASINGAAGIRWCDLRYPESVGIIRVASGDGEQEMIADFFPQIQDCTENHASSRSGGLGCRSWHGLSSPWLGIHESIG